VSKPAFVRRFTSVSFATMVSRAFGFLREILLSRYLGVGADAFLVAFRIPNMLRHIFVEGALSAALVPTIVQAEQDKSTNQASRLVTVSLVIFEAVVLLLCALVVANASFVVTIIAPGFDVGRISTAVPMLQVMIFLIFFLSSNAIFAGALHARNYFFVPAIAPAILNVAFIIGTTICLYQRLEPLALTYMLILGGVAQLALHVFMYKRAGYSFMLPNSTTWSMMRSVLGKLGPAIAGMSIFEVNLLLDNQFASTLPTGSISLLHYSSRFMGVPLGVFSIAFATVLLPHFARVGRDNVERLSFYFQEALKTVFWITVPVGLLMALVTDKIFMTIYLSKHFTMIHVLQAQNLLLIFLSGLFFLSLNKIIMSLFYALHDTRGPWWISAVGIISNLGFNLILIGPLGAYGLALATVISAVLQVCAGFFVLSRRHNISLDRAELADFFSRAAVQFLILLGAFYGIYRFVTWFIFRFCSANLAHMLTDTICFWLWIAPIGGTIWILILITRRLFGLRQYFIDGESAGSDVN